METIVYDNWQKEIINHDGNVLCCTGRQVGKTLTFAAKAAERMIKVPKTRIIAVSLTEDQAFLMRAMVEDYIKEHYKPYLKVPNKDKPTKNKIILNNKSSYIVRPVGNTGDALRGFTADILIVDEAAFMPELMWTAAKPTLLTTAGQIWMCSTPHVKAGWFYEQYEACRTNKSKRFRVWEISSEDVIYNRPINNSWTQSKKNESMKFLEEEKTSMSEVRYAQEYLGLFMEDIQRFFSDEWIDQTCILEQEQFQPEKDYYLGVDIARLGGDETSYEIIRKISKDNMLHIYSEIQKRALTTTTYEKIIELDTLYKFQRIYIDAGAGSLGVGIFDQLLHNSQTKRKTIPVNNRQIALDREGKQKQRLLKEDLYDNLHSLGEQNKIKLLNNENVRLSLRSIVFEILQTKFGMSRIKISGNYDHICEGLIRAAYCSKEKNIKPFVFSFKI